MPSAPGSWKSRLGALAVVLALLIVVQPELRALLFLVDAIGLNKIQGRPFKQAELEQKIEEVLGV